MYYFRMHPMKREMQIAKRMCLHLTCCKQQCVLISAKTDSDNIAIFLRGGAGGEGMSSYSLSYVDLA